MLPFGIQLYSVRDHLADDPVETLLRLKDVGYDHVELFGVGPADAVEWKAMLEDADLNVPAAHVDYETVVDDLPGVIEMAQTIDFEDIIVPWIKVETAKEWVHAALQLNDAGVALRKEGLRLGYHNHDHEFVPIGETTPFDIMFEYTDPENLFLELDIRWCSEEGGDPTALIREFGTRCRYLHVKERPREGEGMFTEVGNGTIDWTPIVDAAQKAGTQWYIVEQDESATDSLESAAISAQFMQGL